VGPASHRRRTRRRTLRVRTILAWLAVLVLATTAVTVTILMRRQPMLVDDFNQPNGLITNEFAYFNRGNPQAVRSPIWILTSGSLFARDNAGWTGVPDVGTTGPRSVSANDSSVFRAVTQRSNFQNVTVSFGLLVQRFMPTASGPPRGWQGVHVFVRYQSPALLYVVSVDRRDGVIVIKKKVPGGSVDGGTYYTLASTQADSVAGRWQQVRVSVANVGAEGVQIRLWLNGRLRLQAVDDGVGDVAPILQPGRVGLRGDYTEFAFSHFTVSPG
jgi:hypothetical protein